MSLYSGLTATLLAVCAIWFALEPLSSVPSIVRFLSLFYPLLLSTQDKRRSLLSLQRVRSRGATSRRGFSQFHRSLFFFALQRLTLASPFPFDVHSSLKLRSRCAAYQ